VADSTVREAIERVSAAISADPSRARAKSAATARLTEGLKCAVTGPRGEQVHTDMPQALGGSASAPNPGWLLRAAMASCATTVIATRAAKLGISLSTLEVTVESESDQRGLLGLDDKVSAALGAWRMKVTIAGSAEPQMLRELVKWADAHSPVGCTMTHGAACALDVDVV
jgi:uncharacterized OsmC-like protein